MERSEVYQMIDGERAYQQARPDEFGLYWHTKTWDWIEHFEHFTRQAKLCADGDERLACFRKLAATCVAALEQHGCPPR